MDREVKEGLQWVRGREETEGVSRGRRRGRSGVFGQLMVVREVKESS